MAWLGKKNCSVVLDRSPSLAEIALAIAGDLESHFLCEVVPAFSSSDLALGFGSRTPHVRDTWSKTTGSVIGIIAQGYR